MLVSRSSSSIDLVGTFVADLVDDRFLLFGLNELVQLSSGSLPFAILCVQSGVSRAFISDVVIILASGVVVSGVSICNGVFSLMQNTSEDAADREREKSLAV